VKKLNEILRAYDKNEIKLSERDYAADQVECFEAKIGSALYDIIVSEASPSNQLISQLLETSLIEVNKIKNFFDQSLLHFAAESNNLAISTFLVEKYHADCLLEDTYRKTPFVIAVKKGNFSIFELFVKQIVSIKQQNNYDSIQRHITSAAYHSSCNGNLQMLEYLFAKFALTTNQLVNDLCFLKNFDSNPIHAACFNGHYHTVEFLVRKLDPVNKELFLNSCLNEFRNCTPLEEAFKGFMMVDLRNELDLLLVSRIKFNELIRSRNESKARFAKIINLLIDNGAKFSANFLVQNGLVNLVGQVFTGTNRDADLVQFMYCVNFLFKFKLNELFSNNDFGATSTTNEPGGDLFDTAISRSSSLGIVDQFKIVNETCGDNVSAQASIDVNYYLEKFLHKLYLTCLKVIKDYKFVCMNQFFNIVVNLYLSGQFKVEPGCIQSKFEYVKERNAGVYADLVHFFENEAANVNKIFTLQTLCCIKIKQSIPSFSMDKVNALDVPRFLRNDIFLNNSLSFSSQNVYIGKQAEFIKYLS
jgi:ankyrin repeat protein